MKARLLVRFTVSLKIIFSSLPTAIRASDLLLLINAAGFTHEH